jgi:hypothetical protein
MLSTAIRRTRFAKSSVARIPLLLLLIATLSICGSAAAQTQPSAPANPSAASPAQRKSESLADAARTAQAQKSAARAERVFTNDDLATLPNSGVSVVGKQSPSQPAAAAPNSADSANAATPAEKGEAYWRARFKALNDRLTEVNGDIKELNDDAANYWTIGYPIRDDYALPYLWDLQAEKVKLDQQMDALYEDARKAGADPGWLR